VELHGGILLYAAQAIAPIDAEIAEKGHLWTETNEHIAIDTIAEGNDPIDP
jgi:hypothetical protein